MPNHSRVTGITPGPQTVADQNNATRAIAIVFSNQSASQKGPHPQHRKSAGRHAHSLNAFGRTRVCKTRVETCDAGQTLKRSVLVAIIAILRQREIRAWVIAAL